MTTIRDVAGVMTAIPAYGQWSIDDADPTVAHFQPLPPTGSIDVCSAGFLPGSTYVINLPTSLGGNPQTIRIDGLPLQTPIHACFTTTSCSPNVTVQPSEVATKIVAASARNPRAEGSEV